MLLLKELRLQTGKNQSSVAADLGLSRQAYSHYENGRRTPDIETIKRMAQYFNVSIDRLLGKFDLQMFADTPQAKAANIAGKILATKDEQKIKLTLEALEKISKMSSDQLEALNIFLSTIK